VANAASLSIAADLDPITASSLTVRTVTTVIQVLAQDPHGSFSTSVLVAVVSRTYRRLVLILTVVSSTPTTMSRLNSTQLNSLLCPTPQIICTGY